MAVCAREALMVEDSESRHHDSPGELAEPADEQRRPGHGRLGVLKSKPTKVVFRTPLSAIYTHSYDIAHATERVVYTADRPVHVRTGTAVSPLVILRRNYTTLHIYQRNERASTT